MTDSQSAHFVVLGPGPHEQVTELLGLKPAIAHNAGDTNRTGHAFKSMYWRLNSGLAEDRPLVEHIEALLVWLTPRAAALRELWLENSLYFQCGLKCSHTFGLHLSREHIRQMAALGIGLDLDGYAEPEGAAPNNSSKPTPLRGAA
ncbi:DUF4279 domain-containing protein [Cognatilysobacter terrigena]|uniref:DUF4279 domain-containing protein n=1 Tax=Cognatilysobacter terrigena TaxID=2488749 RepID=UPI001414ED24|nr:DUF4279 domain-containing protein [Lysobacter terrigena]